MKSFNDKVAVVTGGGGSGIGNALVIALAERGAHVAYCDIAGLEKTSQELAAYSVRQYAEHTDIGNKEAVQRFVANVLREFGRVDVLINNAGIATGDLHFGQLSIEDFEHITNVNYWGVIRMTMALYPHLISRPEAAIANISSSQGILPAPYLVSYCTTKFAVRGFTDSLRVEELIRGKNNLTVHTVHPGAVATQITRNAKHQGPRSELFHRELQQNGLSPAKAASIILDGILANKSRIFISDGRIQDILSRLFPSSVHHFVKWLLKARKAEIS